MYEVLDGPVLVVLVTLPALANTEPEKRKGMDKANTSIDLFSRVHDCVYFSFSLFLLVYVFLKIPLVKNHILISAFNFS